MIWSVPAAAALVSEATGQIDVDTDALADALGEQNVDGWTWLTAGAILLVGLVVSRVAKWAVAKGLGRRIDPALAALLGRLCGYLVVVIALVYSLNELGLAIGPFLGALGIAGIALAFAFRDILENFIAGILLQMQRPFTYGDQVVINDHEGTVRDVGTRLVTIVTPDGETIKIPASTVIKADINNYTEQGLRRSTLDVGVAYGTDLRRAAFVLERAVAAAGGVEQQPPPEVLFDGFGESSLNFVVRFWHQPSIADHWTTKSNVGMDVDAALAAAGITIPFPQQVVHFAQED
ncbi:MAG: mechanosensitive ion channel family protein [Ilumatobacteraceae bacterium]